MLDYKNQNSWEFESFRMQSPIHIQQKNCTKKPYEKLDVHVEKIMNIFDTETGLYYKLKGTSHLLNREFELNHLHFHTGSEHCLLNQHYLIEAHFVCISEVGRLAVIAIFFEEGTHNDVFEDLLNNIEDKTTPADITKFLQSEGYYHYLGSLTTPPLIENVEWYLIDTPLQISNDQYLRYLNQYPAKNKRELQKLNQRKILHYKK